MSSEIEGPARVSHPELASEIGSECSAASLTLEVTPFPVITAYAIGSGAVRFWCDPCRCWHEHGQVFEAGEHRISHCWNPRSPHYRGSYCIDLTPVTQEVLYAIERGKPLKSSGRRTDQGRVGKP